MCLMRQQLLKLWVQVKPFLPSCFHGSKAQIEGQRGLCRNQPLQLIQKDKRLPSLFRGLMADVFEKLAGVAANHNKFSRVMFRISAFKLVSGLLCKNRPVFRPSFQSRYNTNCIKIKKAQTTNGVYLPITRVKIEITV